MKKWKRWLGLTILSLGVVIGGWWMLKDNFHSIKTSTDTASQQYVEKRNVRLVALGDSLTHGEGDEKDNGGYVGIIKAKIEDRYRQTKVATVNYGVTGDRSDQILDRLNQQSQLQKDLKNADVITMTVGGNDLMQILGKNVMGSEKQVIAGVQKGEQVYTQKLTKLFDAVRKENPDVPIFVMSIYNPFYAYFPDVTVINQAVDQWNHTTQDTMKNYQRMYFVDINQVMTYGQYQSKGQQEKLIQAEKKANQGKVSQQRVLEIMNNKDKNLNKYISTEDNFHPNHAGYVKIADQLFQSMTAHDSWEYTRR